MSNAIKPYDHALEPSPLCRACGRSTQPATQAFQEGYGSGLRDGYVNACATGTGLRRSVVDLVLTLSMNPALHDAVQKLVDGHRARLAAERRARDNA